MSAVKPSISPSPKTQIPVPQISSENTAATIENLTTRIREHTTVAFSMDACCRQSGQMAIKAAVEAGNLLHECKRMVGHGGWEEWRSKNLSEISHETVCRWVRLAKASRVTDLSACESLTDAYCLCKILPLRESTCERGKKTEAPTLTSSQAVLRASTTLQKRLRLLVQKDAKISGAERNQLKLLWKELERLFDRVIGEEPR